MTSHDEVGMLPPGLEMEMSHPLQSVEVERAATQLGWYGRLNQATTVEDVVAIARDFGALWSPEELGQLPSDLRPGKLVDADDVGALALALVQAQMGRGMEGEATIHKLGTFFSAASLRLSQILAQSSALAHKRHAASSYGR